MPNWAENILKISGDPERINALREFISSTDKDGNKRVFDFNKVIPTPEELLLTTSPNAINAQEMIDKYGHADWYDFHVNRWGTKWNANKVEFEDTGDAKLLEMRFSTAWSPPEGVISELSILFPDLYLEMWSCDPAMNWEFHMVCDLGGVITAEETPYDQSVKDMFGHEDWYEDEDE